MTPATPSASLNIEPDRDLTESPSHLASVDDAHHHLHVLSPLLVQREQPQLQSFIRPVHQAHFRTLTAVHHLHRGSHTRRSREDMFGPGRRRFIPLACIQNVFLRQDMWSMWSLALIDDGCWEGRGRRVRLSISPFDSSCFDGSRTLDKVDAGYLRARSISFPKRKYTTVDQWSRHTPSG
jgi:hypothetical protein